jgi:hypothetical protein
MASASLLPWSRQLTATSARTQEPVAGANNSQGRLAQRADDLDHVGRDRAPDMVRRDQVRAPALRQGK